MPTGGIGRMARSAITKNGVLVRTRLAEGLFPVQWDHVQVQQVVLNLILNAIEAMGSIEVGKREALISTERRQTGDVLLAVHDSGPGIDPERLARVSRLSNHEVRQPGDGAVDLPVDHRCPWRPGMGGYEQTGGTIFFSLLCPTRNRELMNFP
jgi:hypothetical protein